MTMSSDVLRQHIDAIILARLAREDGYGYRVNRDIMEKAGQKYELKEATLYSAFRRLEKEGLIRSYWGDEEQGARRRYYAITDEGRTSLDTYRGEWKELKATIDALIDSKATGGK